MGYILVWDGAPSTLGKLNIDNATVENLLLTIQNVFEQFGSLSFNLFGLGDFASMLPYVPLVSDLSDYMFW